jgi:hypothetical protein
MKGEEFNIHRLPEIGLLLLLMPNHDNSHDYIDGLNIKPRLQWVAIHFSAFNATILKRNDASSHKTFEKRNGLSDK